MKAVILKLLGAAAILCSLEPFTYATLGQSVDSIDSDQGAVLAVRRNYVAHANYTVHELNTDSVNIREYVSSSGVVFGIAWEGRRQPNFSQFLGSYFSDYQNAVSTTPRILGRRSAVLQSNQLIVHKWGYLGKIQGRAFDPSLVPPGVKIDEIK